MKKLAFTAFVVLLCLAVSGQRWGFKAGVNIANADMDVMGVNLSPDPRTGVHFGLVREMALLDYLYFQPALLFSQKGYEISMDIEGEKIDGYEHFNYLDIPLNLILKAELQGPKLLIIAGPTISFALNGKYKGTFSSGGSNYSDEGDLEFGDGDDKYDKAAFGWNLGGGVEYGAFQLTGIYTFGLSNITHSNDFELKHTVLGISLTYLIGE